MMMILTAGRCDGVIPASGRPIGWVPTREELELLDIEDCEDIHELLSTPTSFWREEVEEMRAYFSTQVTGETQSTFLYTAVHITGLQVGDSLPEEMWTQLGQLERRIGLFEDDVGTEE